MKKFLSITLSIVMLFSLVACNKNEQGQNETKLAEWQEMYQETFVEILGAGDEHAPVGIASAYISDTNADGIPLIALSLNAYTSQYPDIILNYVNGKVVELPVQIDNYGSSVTESIYFVNGTDDIVYRSYGNTTGTFGENEFQKIYSITESGKYELVSDKGFALSEDMSKEYTAMLVSGGNDIYDYQQSIFSQMDDEIEKITGKAPSLVDYKTVAVNFTISSDGSEIDMEKALKYINQMLEIEISFGNDVENTEKNDVEDTIKLPLPKKTAEFVFCSGVGAWQTLMILNNDGSFSGDYSDTDMGDDGEQYPNGTVYVSDFSGSFGDVEKINEYSYRMKLKNVEIEVDVGKEWIEDGFRYIATGPYGLEDSEEFILYLPSTPINMVPSEFLIWWPYRFSQDEVKRETLECYGILSVNTGNGFFYEE